MLNMLNMIFQLRNELYILLEAVNEKYLRNYSAYVEFYMLYLKMHNKS